MNDSNGNNCNCNECVIKSKSFSIPKLYNINICLNRLTELDLSSSNIDIVPELICNLVNITKLDLSSNELVSLPMNFSKFQYLTHLILSHNKLQVIPQCLIYGMSSIITLDLSHNMLVDFNTKLSCVQRLQTLNVSNNTTLSSLPQWLWSLRCKSLESLDISFTGCLMDIKIDPYQYMYGIGKHLKYLNVSNTNSNVLKLDFIKHLKNLRTIVLDNKDTIITPNKKQNFFCNIPMIFNYRFKYITSLSMRNVSLSSIGKQVYFILPNLQYLNLANNTIAILPNSLCELTNLIVLDLSNNQIFSIPECYKSMKKLKKLLLNTNQLSTFPKILDDLLNLEFLDLYANKLITCPSWNSNSRIESLDLEQNLFSTENDFDQDNKNYLNMLKKLRLSINEIRDTGPLCSSNENEFFDDSAGSISNWSSYSISDNDVYIDDNQEVCNLESEEFWECNSYEHTTALFDPKEFESKLREELIILEKPLTSSEKTKEKNMLRNVVQSSNEHYFCPSDELPIMISKLES